MQNFKHTLVKPQDSETAFGYFVNALISARIDTGLRSNAFCLDEDVNIYLAQLLTHFQSDEYLGHIKKYVCLYESDLVARQDNSLDIRERYWLYKHTADYILIMAGIFSGFNRNLPQYKSALRLDNDVYLGRARAYYAQAAEYAVKLHRGESGVSEALRKLSDHFTLYVNVLYHIRENYFNFTERFSDGEWFHFVHKNIIHRKGVDSKVYVALMDDFLERISAWKKDRCACDKDMIRIMAAELKRLNPDFHYDTETLFDVQHASNAA